MTNFIASLAGSLLGLSTSIALMCFLDIYDMRSIFAKKDIGLPKLETDMYYDTNGDSITMSFKGLERKVYTRELGETRTHFMERSLEDYLDHLNSKTRKGIN